MAVLAELWIALLLGALAVELNVASRRAFQAHDRVTEQVVLLDLSLGLTAVLVAVLCLRIFMGLIF